MRTGAHVGRRAGNGARGGETAEEHRGHVADTLRNQLHIRIVPVARHAVRHHTGQQRFDARQQGDGQRVGEQLADTLEGDPVRQSEIGEASGQRAEPGTDGIGRQGEQPHQQRGQEHGHHGRGNFGDLMPDDQDDQQRENRHPERRGAEIHGVLGIGPPLVKKLRRGIDKRQPEEILHLRGEDQQRNPGGEARGHRIGDIFDQRPQPQEPEDDEQDARHQRRQDKPLVAVPGHDAVNDDDERARRPADGEPAPAEKRHEKTGDDGRIQPPFRRQAGSDGERKRERKRHHAHGDPRRNVLGQHPKAVPAADCLKKARNKRRFVLRRLYAGHETLSSQQNET